ncbi:arylesterase [Sphingomonas sp. DBB INV C78]|uniref:arylesterase n=1 Tax=Sphingomonas sp. DBB INV C78 TaxID=3349434 RepID=UPI0036D2F165
MRRLIVHAAALLTLFVTLPAYAADKLVVAFGDSLMAGYQLKPSEGFAPKLEAALRKSGVPARVHNAGVSGDTTAQGKARLGWVLNALKAKPDLVIVELGANDMLRGLPNAQTRTNLDAILTELKRRKIPILLAGMQASPNMGAAYTREFNAIYPALARKHAVPLYPFFLAGVATNRALLLKDGMHPNARGVDVIVRGILPQVRKGLGR